MQWLYGDVGRFASSRLTVLEQYVPSSVLNDYIADAVDVRHECHLVIPIDIFFDPKLSLNLVLQAKVLAQRLLGPFDDPVIKVSGPCKNRSEERCEILLVIGERGVA